MLDAAKDDDIVHVEFFVSTSDGVTIPPGTKIEAWKETWVRKLCRKLRLIR